MDNNLKKEKSFFVFCIIILAAIAALLYVNRNTISGLTAPVYINVELPKEYADNVFIKTYPGGTIKQLVPTTQFYNNVETTVVYTEASDGKLLSGIKLLLSNTDSYHALSAIDNISVFVGNMPYYFSTADIATQQGTADADGTSYDMFGEVHYKNSLAGKWVNYYGDFNFVICVLLATFMNFQIFLPVLALALCLFVIFRHNKNPAAFYSLQFCNWVKQHEKILFSAVVLLGLLLRIKGYVQFSVVGDELSSAEFAKPSYPFSKTFSDPGNPPFYYILLRLCFMLFGWSQETARMFSVILGTAGIVSLYFFVRKCVGVPNALLASIFAAVSKLFIIISHNSRGYILVMFLAPLIALVLLKLLEKQSKKNLVLYAILCMFIVNTHYYGVLLVIGNFLYYIFYASYKKTFTFKKTLLFFIANILIALSLLPFMIRTAFSRALLVPFNDWIKALGLKKTMLLVAGIAIFAFVYFVLQRLCKAKSLFVKQQRFLLSYSIYICCFIVISALFISLVKPIFTMRYLAIFFPFILAGLSVCLMLNFKTPIRVFFAVLIYGATILLYHKSPPITVADVPNESQFYISADASAHPNRTCAVLERYDTHDGYFGYDTIPLYTINSTMPLDVLYVSPLHFVEAEMMVRLKEINLDSEDSVYILVNEKKPIIKKYFRNIRTQGE
ncbi:MAG: glycosyltransferase family 39 protein [Spirochaetaceae bacterium]|jgi:hypothetical protein|nr:glycosyltransferase family 39 protein [Spirochaetaceae bacterium]